MSQSKRNGHACCPACGFRLGTEPEQLDLSSLTAPAAPKARRRDPLTSKRAAKAAFPTAGTQRAKIIVALVNAGHPLTAEEIAQHADLKYVSVSTRCTELVRHHWCRIVGERDGKNLLDLTEAARRKLPQIMNVAVAA